MFINHYHHVLLFVVLVFSAIIGAQDWSNYVCPIATGLQKVSLALERVLYVTSCSAWSARSQCTHSRADGVSLEPSEQKLELPIRTHRSLFVIVDAQTRTSDPSASVKLKSRRMSNTN